MKQIKSYQRAFTLVELIVVITILAILATISVIYFLGNMSESRDSARYIDMKNIETNLDLWFIDNGSYPEPDNAYSIVYSGALAWSQGEFGEQVTRDMRVFGSELLQDPKYENFYTYSITNKGREYQLAAVFENIEEEEEGLGEIVQGVMIPSANAAGVKTAYALGNYNGFMVRTQSGSTTSFIATPSIITNDISDLNIINIISEKKLVYSEFFNLPHTYVSLGEERNGGFNFNVTDPVLFSGNINLMKQETTLLDFNDRLKYVYSTTPTESFDKYLSVLEEDGLNRIKKFLTKYFKIPFKTYFNCFDIKDDEVDDGDGYYSVDPDGDGGNEPYLVWCLMDSYDGGYTRKGESRITNGNFSGGNPIASESGSRYKNEIVNLGAGNTPVAGSTYAVYQTEWSNSEYEVHFDDFSDLTSGDLIILSLWVRDDDQGVTWYTCTTPACLHNTEPGYMFHNRLYYTDGTTDVNGVSETLQTVTTSDGKIWMHKRISIPVRKNPSGFNWYIGYGAEGQGTTDLYITGVNMEVYYK